MVMACAARLGPGQAKIRRRSGGKRSGQAGLLGREIVAGQFFMEALEIRFLSGIVCQFAVHFHRFAGPGQPVIFGSGFQMNEELALIGGGGKRVLALAAQAADIVGINGTLTAGMIGPDAISTMTAAAVDEKIGYVHAAAGNRLSDIELNVRAFFVKVTDQAGDTMDRVAQMLGVDQAMVRGSPFALIGSAAKLVEDLIARREKWGYSYIIVGGEDVDYFAPVVATLNGK